MGTELASDIRRDASQLWFLREVSLLRIHGHGLCAVNSTCVASTDVEPCSTLSLKSGILLLRQPSWLLTHCVGDTHYKINVHQPIASALGGCRERNALFRTFFIFTLFRPPPEEGSPFVTIIKITSFFSWDLQSRLRDVSVFLLRFLAIDSSLSNPITINVIDFVYVGTSSNFYFENLWRANI